MNSLYSGGNTLDFLDKIYVFCAERHISASRFEREAGIAKGLISKWKNKGFTPSYKTQKKIASYMCITVEDLMRELPGTAAGSSLPAQADTVRDASVRYVPVLRDVSAFGSHDESNIAAYIPVFPDMLHDPDNCFAMKITDSSMLPELGPGDVVIVRRCEQPDHGDIVIVCAPGRPTVCRKLVREEEGIVLQPFNRHFDSVSFRYEEMDMLPVSFIGKVIGMHRDISGKPTE